MTAWPNAARSRGRDEQARDAVDDLVLDAADAAGDDRPAPSSPPRSTVSPKPSASDFCTTTAAWRWIALTIAPFSSASAIGSVARWMRRRAPARQRPPCRASTSARTAAPSGSSCTPVDVGADEQQVRVAGLADVAGEALQHADRVLEAVPARHLRDDAVVRGAAARSCTMRAGRVHAARASRPRARTRRGGPPPATTPAALQDRRDGTAGPSSWFLGEKTSIDGGTIATRRPSIPPTRSARARTRTRRRRPGAGAAASQAARTVASGSSTPMCAAPDDVARPPAQRGGHAQRLRVVQDHDVAGPHERAPCWRRRRRDARS